MAGGITAEVRAAAPGAAVTRVAGADRYETAAELAAEYGDLTGNVVVATGADFADALRRAAGRPFAADPPRTPHSGNGNGPE